MRVAFGIGSNLGDRLAHLRAAVAGIAEVATATPSISPVVETDPVGGPDQADYLNAVVVAHLPDSLDLLALAGGIEQGRGRVRRERWGPRTLDVDVLAVDGRTSADPALTLPHPRAHLRAFVLVPWHAVDPAAEIAGHGSVAALLDGLGRTERGRRDLAGVRPVVLDRDPWWAALATGTGSRSPGGGAG